MWIKAKSPIGLVNLRLVVRVFVREEEKTATLYAEKADGRLLPLAEHENAEVLRMAQDRIEDRLAARGAVFDLYHYVELGHASPLELEVTP